MNTAKLLFRGAGLQVFMMIISVGCSFFLAPFVIHSLGDRWYGLWVLIGSFIGFYGLLDFGISSATQRYLAHALPRDDAEELNTIVASSLAMFCGIALVALLVTAGLAVAAPLFMDNPHDVGIFRIVVFIMGASFALSIPFYTQYGILAANLRFDYSSYIQILKTIVRTTAFFLILSWGYGIVALAVTTITIDILSFGLLIYLARRVAPWMSLRYRHITRSMMRELAGFGVYSFVSQLAGTVKYRIDNIVIAGSLGLAPVTHFNIATRLNEYFFSFLGRMVPASTTVYARYHGKGEHGQIREKFLIFSRINTILGILGVGAVLIFARPFITLWVGKQYLDAFLPLVVIMAARIPSITMTSGTGVIYAMAKQKFTAYLNLGEAAANLALSLLLVQSYGLVGVALGTAIPLVATRLTIMPVYMCRIMNMPVSRFLASVMPVAIVAGAVQLPLVYAMTKIDIHAYWQIAAWGAAYYTPVLIFFFIVMLTPEERRLFMKALPSIRLKRPGKSNVYKQEA